MASTRNKNTPGNYAMEKLAYQRQFDETVYMHSSNGKAPLTNHPGNGLLSGRIAAENLSRNFCDIESKLFGIGSSNLEQGAPNIVPDIYNLKSLNVMQKQPMIKPEPLTILPNQRPMYLN